MWGDNAILSSPDFTPWRLRDDIVQSRNCGQHGSDLIVMLDLRVVRLRGAGRRYNPGTEE